MAVDPSKLRIDVYPTDTLRKKALPVELTPEVSVVAQRLIELMIDAEGIGLAAPQVGLSWRLFVADVPPSSDGDSADEIPNGSPGPEVFVNPEIIETSGEIELYEEGCLSLPDILGDVLRPPTVTLRATGLDGKQITRRATGMLARCWQHEIDHLDGVLIIDKMTQMSRLKNRAAIRSLEKDARR